jgi:DNA-binding NtrC family response regulator
MVNGTFPSDFYERVAQYNIETEPLKDRPEDVIVLLKEINPKADAKVRFLLYFYDWPGNVRELESLADKDYSYIKQDLIRKTSARLCKKQPSEATPSKEKPPDETPSKEIPLDTTPSFETFFDLAAEGKAAQELDVLHAISMIESGKFDLDKLIRTYEICLMKSAKLSNNEIAKVLRIRRETLSQFEEKFSFQLSSIKNFPDFIKDLRILSSFQSQKQ